MKFSTDSAGTLCVCCGHQWNSGHALRCIVVRGTGLTVCEPCHTGGLARGEQYDRITAKES